MDRLCYNEGGCNFAIFTAGLYSKTVGECCLLGSMELGANGTAASPSPAGTGTPSGISPTPSPGPASSPAPTPSPVVAKPPPVASKPPPPTAKPPPPPNSGSGSLVNVSITVSRRVVASAPPPPATRTRSTKRGLQQTSTNGIFDAASCSLLADVVNRRLRALRNPVGWDVPYR